jgi:MerR family redox-sensitive transcriptional activator SoxR
MTIGELSARSGVSASALRFYEREGLIESSRTDGNQRRYEPVTLRLVALIQAGKVAGIPLERIRTALRTLRPERRRRSGIGNVFRGRGGQSWTRGYWRSSRSATV